MAKNPRNGCIAKLLALLVAGIVGLASTGMARAQGYPGRPITMIVPFAAGGPTDMLARILAQRMAIKLGQSIIIENVSGAAGSIGVGRVARSSPDGYTLSIGNVTTHVFNGAIIPLPYDLLKDFEPIAMVASNPQLLLGKREIEANTLQELIAFGQSKDRARVEDRKAIECDRFYRCRRRRGERCGAANSGQDKGRRSSPEHFAAIDGHGESFTR